MPYNLNIRSPKRTGRRAPGWEGFFPYYAGFPESFVQAVLESAELQPSCTVLDPWNGSGTTTYAASRLGYKAIGFDLNPVMVVVARARLLPKSEADSIEPLAAKIIRAAKSTRSAIHVHDPLEVWFYPETAAILRALEQSIQRHLLGSMSRTSTGVNLDRISAIAATFYVALFLVARQLAQPFQSSNPTWLRRPRATESKILASRSWITEKFRKNLADMAAALGAEAGNLRLRAGEVTSADLRLQD